MKSKEIAVKSVRESDSKLLASRVSALFVVSTKVGAFLSPPVVLGRRTFIPKKQMRQTKMRSENEYRIYSNKRRGAYLISRVSSAVLIRGRRLFKRLIPQRQNILIVEINLLHEYSKR